ncbi:helix-turn-helix domain-containing protein [Paenibacillus sp. Leaf72]|uniref:helix-turn-helix domain-containing protein n=1 Tax=Paenibacillus sp. Leaf72 TaxID=1736234 RepID=UPI0006FDF5D7|nr:helix-turn-helix domain-containing protein [Paenibacillus sp. Leaf72]KQO16689.1 two-component system response regulator [Paenibacillus sp. Leaf72]
MSEITMCIIDDVKTVIDGIVAKIPWGEHGIKIVGTAANGNDGLQLIKEKHPHIVLTDIRMPMRSGIDMVREMKESGEPEAKVIFFSGFTDFTYAQESVRLGAFDYLVKPFTTQQIVEVVLRAKAKIETQRLEQLDRMTLERKVRESLPYLRQEYFRLLIRHDELPERAYDKWEFLSIDMDTRRFVAMSVQIEGLMDEHSPLSVREVELTRFAVQNIMEETIKKQAKGVVFREHLGQFVILLNPNEEEEMLALAEACRDNVNRYAKRDISIGVGSCVEGISEIALSYNQAKTALSYQFYSGSGCVISYSDIERQNHISPHYSADKEVELLYCLRSGNREGTEKLLVSIAEECLRYPTPPDPDVMTNLFYGLAFSIYRVIAEKADSKQRMWLDERLSVIKKGRYSSTSELIKDVKELGLTGCDWLQKRQKNNVGQLIHQAMNYVGGRLGTDLTVQECANVVHLSPSYFSNLFKKETGMTFMQYVTSARMDKAKELLLEGMQVQDITYELGYRDRPYFTELFKKHTGLTPTEFRSKYESSEPEA